MLSSANNRGQQMAIRQAQLRGRMEPKAFGYAGRQYDCTSKSLDADRRGDLLEEGAGNAESVDQRLISLNPSDFTRGTVFTPPAEGSGCTYQGGNYLIKKVLSCEQAYGTKISLPVIIYRAPAGDSKTTVTPAEAAASGRPQDAGKRKTY